ncbi:ATP-binding protein [Lentzea terrae]|uniref:ATP-binding protein n=1 Tax=Lentzea terrae TaxID=2200761 RepID=UPI0013004178|nr:ATP-binding protein [Lentzea terrae]
MSGNPYRSVGQRVTGQEFVGRADLLWRVRSTWDGSGLGNLSVQGFQRMGKSSLVAQAVEHDAENRPDLLFTSLSVGDHDNGPMLFQSVLRTTHEQLVSRSLASVKPYLPVLDGIVAQAKGIEDDGELRDQVKTYYRHLTNAGVSTIVVLDEFDRADGVFTKLSEFQVLRSLASERFSIGLVTVSRRPVENIEIDAAGGSTLDAVLSLRCDVGCFADKEIDLLLARALQAGVDLSEHRAALIKCAGGHPYLLSLLCHEVMQIHQQSGRIDVPAARRALAGQFESQFRGLVKTLDTVSGRRGEYLLRKVAGDDAGSLPNADVDLLTRLGLVREEAGVIRLFSDEFQQYVLRTTSVM